MTALRKCEILNPSAQIVYRGRDAAGAISQHGRKWVAYDSEGRSLGRFATRLAAFAAVLKSGRAQ